MTAIAFELGGITSHTEYPDGSLNECTLNEPNLIATSVGDLVPRFSRPDARSKELKSISFYPSGAVRSISLDVQQPVKTPIGDFPAELVTFYEDGSLDTVFPLNGQIGFGWSEAEEKKLAETYSFEFTFGTITTKIIGMRFYATGEVKSVILWPGDEIAMRTPMGVQRVRAGFRVFPGGELESFEPASPVDMMTPIGLVRAYDVNALTVDADHNSVRFDESGALTHLATSGDIVVRSAELGRVRIASRTRMALSRDEPVKLPINIAFHGEQVTISNGEEEHTFTISECRFLALPDIDPDGLIACETGCDSCATECA